MKKYLVAAAATSALCLFAPRSSFAQQTGFAVNHFEPSERGSEWFVMESLDLRGNLRPAVGVVADWAYRPLVLQNSNGVVQDSIVRNQIFLHVGGGIVLWDRVRASVNVPVLIFNEGRAGLAAGVTYPPPASSAGVGDMRVGIDVRLFGTYGDLITGAVGAQLTLPTGDPASYSGDGSVRAMPRVLIAGDVGLLTYAAKLGMTIRGLDEHYADGQVGTDILFGASAGLRLLDKKLVVGPEVFGHSVVSSGAFFTKKATPLEGLLGAHYTVARDFRIGAGVSVGLTAGFGTPQQRGLLSVEWVPSVEPPDRDHDGILDVDDACPDVPGVRTSDPKTNGCPIPPDRDHDGILDSDDECIDVPGLPKADANANGCPPDRDHDGIPDASDACVGVQGVKTSDPKTNGCPPDRDQDGILDEDDACVDVPGVRTSDPKTNGCPVDPDRDKDTILNDVDACPDEPGKADPDPKRNGCPKAFVQSGQIVILDQVKFKTASAVIQPGPDSEEVLTAVIKVLKEHDEITSVRIEGHTDNRGSAQLNKKLSADRAASVVKWLSAHGIVAARLTSQGFGQERPKDTNDTDPGRANNRRVEFHIQDAPKK